MPVDRFLSGHRGAGRYDIILMDPPYADPAIERTIATVAANGLAAPKGILVVGHATRVPLADSYPGATRIKFRRHGDSCFSIYALGDESAEPSPDDERPA